MLIRWSLRSCFVFQSVPGIYRRLPNAAVDSDTNLSWLVYRRVVEETKKMGQQIFLPKVTLESPAGNLVGRSHSKHDFLNLSYHIKRTQSSKDILSLFSHPHSIKVERGSWEGKRRSQGRGRERRKFNFALNFLDSIKRTTYIWDC